MLRDASQKQVIQKFSFIESLNLSRMIKMADRVAEEIEPDRGFNFIPQISLNSSAQIPEKVAVSSTTQSDSASVSTAIKTNPLANLSNLEASSLNIGEIAKYSALNPTANNNDAPTRNYLGKILFALSLSYCLFVLWWLFGHEGSKLITHLMGGKYITLSQSEVKFIDHMERSLDTLDRQLETEKSKSDQEDQVVYVPVYTPSQNTPHIPTPSTVVPSGSASTLQPTLPPTPETLEIPAPPPLPAPASVPNPVTESSTTIESTVTKPIAEHTLIGILELGAGKSAALVKVNGQTRRFGLGEAISDSGWILESINDQTAQINYQGQLRSIAVGETF
jgi:hypothetical protein